MDVPSAVVVFLLFAQAAGGPVRREALDDSIREMEKERQEALRYLNDPEQFPNNSCVALNITEQVVGAAPPSLPTSALYPFFYCTEKVVALIQEPEGLSGHLMLLGQYIHLVLESQGHQTPSHSCSVPSFEQWLDKYLYVKCQLQLLGQWLSMLSNANV